MSETTSAVLQGTGGLSVSDWSLTPVVDHTSFSLPYAVIAVNAEIFWDSDVIVGSSYDSLSATLGDLVSPTEWEFERSLADEFQECAAAWKRETGHLSVAGQIAKHHAYRRIIEMGESVIPLILEDLSEKPNHWFLALSAIANEAPAVPERDKGDMKAISAAWIEWGREKDYIE